MQDQALGSQGGPYGREIGLQAVQTAGEGGGGSRAELELTAGLDAEPGIQGQGAGRIVRGAEPLGRKYSTRPLRVQYEPFELGAEGAGRAGLETDAVDQILGGGLAQRG